MIITHKTPGSQHADNFRFAGLNETDDPEGFDVTPDPVAEEKLLQFVESR